jgi:hypothetical protein
MNVTGGYRAAIGAIDREVTLLSELERKTVADGTALVALRASWGELRSHLATGTFPGALAAAHGPGEGTR